MIKRIAKKESINKLVNWVDGETFKIIESGKVAQVSVEVFDQRTFEQNKKIHAMMEDIRSQAVFRIPGKVVRMSDYSSDESKSLLVMWFANEMKSNGEGLKKPPKLIIDPFSGEKYTIRPSTKDEIEIDETAKFIEWLYATGAETGVRWSEPALKEYETYRGAQR